MKFYNDLFDKIVSTENLFSAWDAFKRGKGNKLDILKFEWNLEENIFKLHRELKRKSYIHGPYFDFYITDPKRRHVHKASVRDRILHHAIFNIINPIFEPTFIPASFSCRVGFGVHRGVEALMNILRRVSQNNTKPAYVLKCDVKKFFDTIDHSVLLAILNRRIKDADTMRLLRGVVESFMSDSSDIFTGRGVPIGNLTSQLFANIYMNELDKFMKQGLKVKNYLRYTDDFVIVANDQDYLKGLLPRISGFLADKLGLELHPEKVYIRKFHQGIDFLGYVAFPSHNLLRTTTKKRILTKLRSRIREYDEGKISKLAVDRSLKSYLGALSHANSYRFSEEIQNQFTLLGLHDLDQCYFDT